MEANDILEAIHQLRTEVISGRELLLEDLVRIIEKARQIEEEREARAFRESWGSGAPNIH